MHAYFLHRLSLLYLWCMVVRNEFSHHIISIKHVGFQVGRHHKIRVKRSKDDMPAPPTTTPRLSGTTRKPFSRKKAQQNEITAEQDKESKILGRTTPRSTQVESVKETLGNETKAIASSKTGKVQANAISKTGNSKAFALNGTLARASAMTSAQSSQSLALGKKIRATFQK